MMNSLTKSALLATALLTSTTGFAYDWVESAANALLKQATHAAYKTARAPHASLPQATDVPLPAATGNFGACREYFANGEAPVVPDARGLKARALCFDGFAVLHSGKTKTPIFSAERLNRASLAAARDEKRTDVFFEDARLPSSERATLDDYRGSGFDRGHMSPAGDRDNERSMAQSFSLTNIVPQAPENNRKTWSGLEKATRNYANRAQGNIYVITGPYYDKQTCPIAEAQMRAYRVHQASCTIGSGVAVPSHLFKLVYDPATNRAWAHWLENTDWARPGKPISYQELVLRTGIDFLPGVRPNS